MISLFLLIYLLCGLALYGRMMWAITTDLTMIDKFVFFLMVVLASPVLFIVLIVMKKRG